MAIWRRSCRKASKRAELRLEFVAVESADELSAEAEKATLGEPAEDGDGYLLDALTTAILRSAGIPLEEGEQNGHIDS